MRLFGFQQENVAKSYLQQQGLSLVEQNFSSRFGEIDLIMLDASTLCFIEVKYRSSDSHGGAAASITASKQRKIIRTAEYFLARFPHYQKNRMRFDAVFISRHSSLPAADTVNWVKGAFYTT